MNRVPVVIAVLGALLGGTQASAVDWKNQSFATKRQAAGMVIDCMRKRMSKRPIDLLQRSRKGLQARGREAVQSAPSGPLVADDTKP